MNYIKIGLSVLAVAIIVALASCDTGPRSGSDGYKFESKEFERNEIELEVVVIPNQAEFNRLKRIHAPDVEGLQAFGSFSLSTNQCTIYIKDPSWTYEPEWIGHEIAHCIWGRWHGNRNQQEEQQGLR